MYNSDVLYNNKFIWMKRSIITLLLLKAFTLSAQTSTDRVYLQSRLKTNYYYKYDEQGRLAQKQCNEWNYYESYVYKKDTIYLYMVNFPDSTVSNIYKLNKDGLVETTYFALDNAFEHYVYSNGLVSKMYTTDSLNNVLDSFVYDIKNGDKIKKQYYTTNTSSTEENFYRSTVDAYEYSDAKNNLTNQNFGQAYLGKSNTHLFTKNIEKFVFGNKSNPKPLDGFVISAKINSYTYEYINEFFFKYTYDEKGRLKEEIKFVNPLEADSTKITEIKTRYYYY